MSGSAAAGKGSRVGDSIAHPRRAAWTLTVPVMLGMAIQTLYGIVDSVGFGAVFHVLADPGILAMAVDCTRVTVGMDSGRTFQGLGSGLPGPLLTSVRVVLISVPLAYLLTRTFGLGLRAAWVAMPVSAFVSSVAALAWINARLRRLEAAKATASRGAPP